MTVEIVWQRVESFCAFPIFVWELPSYLLFRASSRDKACFEFSNVPLKHSFWRVCPGKPESFSFDKTCFIQERTLGDNCWSVALKCFSTRLKMCTHIEDSFFLESFFLCRGGEKGYCVIRDWVLLISWKAKIQMKIRELWVVCLWWYVNLKIFCAIFVTFNNFFSWKWSFSWKQILQWSQWTFKWTFLKV